MLSDWNVEIKERKKQEKYQGIAREISRLRRAETKVISVFVGALEVILKKEIGIPNRVRTS